MNNFLFRCSVQMCMQVRAATQQTDAAFAAKTLLSKFNATKITEWVPN